MYHLKRDGKKNLSGLISFFFLNVDQILRDPRLHELRGQSLLIEEIPLSAGAFWYQGLVTKFTLNYDQERRENRTGEYFEQNLSGIIARQSPELSEILRSLDRRKFVIVARDYNGYLRLIGSKETPLSFSYTGTSGTNPSDRNQVSFNFKGQTRRPSLFIHGDIYHYLTTEANQPNFGEVGITNRVLSDNSTFRILQP